MQRTKTCAGCRWLDAQETRRAREWDEIDPDRHDWQSSRELPWTVQGLLSVETAYQQRLSPDDIFLRHEQARADEKRELKWKQELKDLKRDRATAAHAAREAEIRRTAEVRARRAAEAATQAKSAEIRAKQAEQAEIRERSTAEYRAAKQAALDETLRQMRDSGSLPPPGVVHVPVYDKVLAVGQTVFWHPFGACTCLTQAPSPICLCGSYRLTWP